MIVEFTYLIWYYDLMEKIKFESKDVIAVIFATTIYVLAEFLEQSLINRGIIFPDVHNWFRMRVLVDIIMAALFGPIVGVVSGVGGALLVNVVYFGSISYVDVLAYGFCGFFVGRYYDKLGVLRGEFQGIKILDFNVIQLLCNLFCSSIISPLLFFLLEGTNLIDSINISLQIAFGSILVTGIIGTLILIIISKIARKRR